MGGVQTQRHTKGKRNRRRSHLALKKTFLAVCDKCDREVLPHHICAYCGYYNKREVIDVLAKLDKKEKKKRLKEEAAAQTARGEHKGGENMSELNPEELSKK
ncbi:MAG: 50S ribosomal protein L32 [Parcubacteria group bacterium]|nr:50S ribosomal protein L32 [Parcubacteria group bacterium]